jgi:polysaccharide pyruvyl transferase WcaK-like protein
MKRICVIGNFSGRNAGDAAILGGLLEDVSRLYPDAEFWVPTIAPGFVRRQYAAYRVRPVGLLPWNLSAKIFGLPVLRATLGSDLVLVTDAILFDRRLWNPLFNYLSTMALVLPLAAARGVPVVLYNVSLGPVATRAGVWCLRRVVDAARRIVVRDRESLALLDRIGRGDREALVGADCALNVRPAPPERLDAVLAREGVRFGERGTITFNANSYLDVFVRERGPRVRADDFARLLARVADRTIEELGVRLVFVVTQPMDLDLNRAVRAAMTRADQTSLVSNLTLTYEDLAGLFARVGLHVGMRTHSLILATAVGTPAVGIMATPKNRGYMRSIEQDARMVEFGDGLEDRLLAAIRASWANRERIAAELKPIIAREKEKARRCAAELLPFLSDRKPTP